VEPISHISLKDRLTPSWHLDSDIYVLGVFEGLKSCYIQATKEFGWGEGTKFIQSKKYLHP
jgi:hypothetical protein